MAGDHLAADRQPDAVAREPAAAMSANKHIKDASGILHSNANPMIAHSEEPLILLALRPDMDAWSLVAVELDGIAKQVAEDQPEFDIIACHCRQRIKGDLRLTFVDSDLQHSDGTRQHIVAIDGAYVRAVLIETGIRQQFSMSDCIRAAPSYAKETYSRACSSS